MLKFIVDESLCTQCGQCACDCVAMIIKQEGNNLPSIAAEDEEQCLRCQHCLAVCPAGAISVFGKSPADSQPILSGSFPDYDKMAHFVRARRSIRHYKDKNVDTELIKSLLTTLAYAPTGVNACELVFNVVDDIAVMQRLKKEMVALIKSASSSDRIPERYSHILELPEEQIDQLLFRGAPHVLVVSAPVTAPCAADDTTLAVAYFELLAQSAGLGCVWWGFFKMFSSLVPEIKSLFGLPDDHVFSAALFGYPDIKFARTVQRDDAAVIRRVSL